jgi:hypothetical protein
VPEAREGDSLGCAGAPGLFICSLFTLLEEPLGNLQAGEGLVRQQKTR